MKNNNEKLSDVMQWLKEEIKSLNFGEVGFILTLHNGEIKRITKTITEKEA